MKATGELVHYFVSQKDLDEVHQFMNKYKQQLPQFFIAQQENQIRLRTILIPLLQSKWSIVLKQNNRLVGVYLQIDSIDFIEFYENNKALMNIGMFQDLYGSVNKIVGLERGNCLVSLLNVFENGRNVQQLQHIYMGLMFYKVIGWQYLIFPTQNPVPFLKVGGQIWSQSYQSPRKYYTIFLNTQKLSLHFSPFRRVAAKL